MENNSDNKRKKRVLSGTATLNRRDDNPAQTNGPVGRKDGYQGRRTQDGGKRGLLDGIPILGQSASNQQSQSSGANLAGSLLGSLLKGKSSKIVLLLLAIVAIFFLVKCVMGGNCSILGQGGEQYGITDLEGSNTFDISDNDAPTAVSASTSATQASYTVSDKARGRYTTIKGGGEDVVTVMVYICGSDLESEHGMATADLNEMLHANLDDDKVKVIVETGGAKKWKNSVISNQTNQRYRVTSKGLQVLDKNVGSRSMVDPNTLVDFIQFCKKNYPANRYMLIFWDHGGGAITGYGYDQKASGTMTLDKINSALKKGGVQFDFIGFDACLMGTLETALVTEPYADYLIASEEAEPGTGWYYTNWLSLLSDNTSISTVELSKKLIDDFTDVSKKNYPGCNTTLSIVDLAEFAGTVPSAFNAFSGKIGSMLDDSEYQKVAEARADAREFGVSSKVNHIDVIDFASKVGGSEANALVKALKGCVKYNRTSVSMKNSNGISIYFPYSSFKSMNSAVSLYNSIGVPGEYSDCIKSFASLAAGGQIASGGTSGSPLGSLLGGYSSASLPSSGDMLSTLLGSYLGGSGSDTSLTSLFGGSSSLFGGSSSNSAMDLLGGILGGGSSSWFDSDRALANADYYDLNSLTVADMALTTNAAGERVLKLSDEKKALVESVRLNLFVKEGDYYVDLGMDNADVIDNDDLGLYDANGDMRVRFDHTWLTVNGQPVAFYFTDHVDDGKYWAEFGYVPILLNGEPYYMFIAFDNETEAHEYGYVAGVQPVYDEEKVPTVAKGFIPLKAEDKIDIICDRYGEDGSYENTYKYGNQITVGNGLEVGYRKLTNSGCCVSYCLTDIYGNEFWTETVPFN